MTEKTKLLSRMLSNNEGINVCGIASNGQEVLAFIEKEKVDLVMLDIHMPYLDGMEVMDIIFHSHPGIKILVLSSDTNARLISKSLMLGASGYLSKIVSMEEIIEAVIKVSQGKKYLSLDIMKSLLNTRDEEV